MCKGKLVNKVIDILLDRNRTVTNSEASAGLLILRLGFGLMMAFGHGLGKLTGFGERATEFSDPLGVGSTMSMALVVFAEFFCSLAVVLGFATRAAVVPLAITMLVAVLVIHGDDPWKKQEFAMLYLVPYLTLLLTGPGRYSLDQVLFGKK